MKGAIDLPDPLTLGPRSIERPADTGATLVAGIDGRAPALVDGGGLITPGTSPAADTDRRWSIDWWIGADDRWHIPAREPSVRQRRIGHGPIIETSLRVPSGDVVHTAYPVVIGGRTITVIDIRNDSPVPVALALAIRPYPVGGAVAGRSTGDGGRSALSLDLVDGNLVVVDGVPMIRLPRQPNEAGATVDRDLLDAVEVGGRLTWPERAVGRSANAVCLYPLPHKTSLRFAVESAGSQSADLVSIDPTALPDAESVARGWTAVVDRAARFEFPDSGITALAGAARARLVMVAADLPVAVVDGEPGAGRLLEGLAIGGHRFECRPSVEAFARTFPSALRSAPLDGAAIVNGVSLAAELLDDAELSQALLEPMTQLTKLVERAAGRRGEPESVGMARLGLARLVAQVGQARAADGLRRGLGAGPTIGLDTVTTLAASAAPCGRWNVIRSDGPRPGASPGSAADTGPAWSRAVDSAERAARFWIGARQLLVREGRSSDGRSSVIELLPDFPTAWRGGAVEVHDAPISGCRVSFAVRWHGYRPALLWDVSRQGSGDTGAGLLPEVTCPGLDPSWRAAEPKGEALLSGSADELPDAPQPGDSFL